MKFISITKSINIRPDWPTIGARLKAGTPLDITGAVANSSAAVGILADDADKSSAEVAVVTEGSIDLAEVTASYGELADDCIAAIKGVSFIGSDGNPIVPSGGGGGSGVFVVNNTFDYDNYEWSRDKTNAEIAAAHDAGQLVVMRMRDADGIIADEMNAIASVATEGGDLVGLSAYATAIKSAPDYFPDIGYIVPAYVFSVKYSTFNEWQYFTNGPTLSAVIT